MDNIKVFYDGACPLCRREIKMYQKMSTINPINWINIAENSMKNELCGLTINDLKKRLHVLKNEKLVFTGGAAFSEIWLNMTRLRWIGKIFKIKPFNFIIEYVYCFFLLVRPSLQIFFIYYERQLKKLKTG